VRKGQTPTSSEKLLRIIRGANATAAAGRDEAASRAVAADKPCGRPGRFLPFWGARAVVGVDVSRRAISVAAVRRRDGEFEVLALEKAALAPSVALDSEEFSRVLGAVLARACLRVPHPEIWCTISSSQADMRLVGVPKVPSSQRDNAVFWTARKELSFDEKTVIFDFEDRGELVDKGAVKSAVFAHTIPREVATRRKAAFERAGYTLTGMTLTAFADQNVFRSGCLPPPPGGAANLHVGDNWSRLEIYRDGDLVFTRGIKAAMTALVGAVQEGLTEEPTPVQAVFETPERAPVAEVPLDMGGAGEVVLDLDGDGAGLPDAGEPRLLTLDLSGAQARPEPAAPAAAAEGGDEADREEQPAAQTAGVAEEDARAVLMTLVDGEAAVAPGRPGHGLSPEEVMDLADPALSRLARQVEMTLKHYRETLGNDPVGAVYVSGPLAAAPAFLEYLEGHLGIPCEPFDPLGASEIRRPGPGPDPAAMSLAGRCDFQQALGAALSRERMTPNLFVTYKERREARRIRLVNRATLAVFCLLVAVVAGYSLFETGRNRGRAAELGRLREQIAAQAVMVDTALLNRTAEEAKKTQESIRAYSGRNLGLGAISELTSLTPADVKLLSLAVDMGPPVKEPAAPQPGAAGKAAQAKPPVKYVKKLIIDGVVEGDSQLFESILAGYLVNLQNSPLFGDSTVSKRDVETMGGAPKLHFVVSLALAGQ
jgi:Tfp pilus assembly PilM family ATPase